MTARSWPPTLNRELASITSVRAIVSARGRPAAAAAAAAAGGAAAPACSSSPRATSIPEIARWIQPILAARESNPGLARPRLDYEPTSPRVMVNIDREKAAALGVSAQTGRPGAGDPCSARAG